LTGLYNRRYLLVEVPKQLEETQCNGVPLSIALIDMDHFKNVNDTYGHTRGDTVLKEFGEFLKNLLRQNDTVFRYGGDEFICILPDSDYKQAANISKRFIQQCKTREFTKIRLTLSIGIASSPENAKDWNSLFEIADRNLYSAKRHGRDQIGIFEEEKKVLIIPTKEIIGRNEELTRLKELINPIFSDIGGAVCISGEIGVGKTRLVQEIVRNPDFQNIRFLNSNLSATTKSIPYYPFREIIRTAIKKGGEESLFEMPQAYQIELVKIVPELSGKSRGLDKGILILDKFRLFEGVRRFLVLRASKDPLFVCFDNIHWADNGSLELLHYLVRALKENPIFFFFVYRIEEANNSSFQNVLQLMIREGLYERTNLEPLETADVARMISLIMDGSPPSELTQYILKETGGNPYFTEELMKSLEANGAFIRKKDRWVFDKSKRVVIPYSVEGVVDRKLAMLSNEACDLLEYAAVIGREFDFTLLRDITRMNEGHLFDLMDEILGLRLLRERELGYSFSGDVIREVIYHRLGGVKLRRYHQTIGEWLSSIYAGRTDEVIEELAHHFYLSGDWHRALKYSIIAADKAQQTYANKDAIRFYSWVLECLREKVIEDWHAKEIEYLRKRAEVWILVGENNEAFQDLKVAFEKAKKIKNRKEQADCLTAFSEVYRKISQYNNAKEKIEKALKIYQNIGDRKGEALCFHLLGDVYYFVGENQKALHFCQYSLKIRKEIGDRQGEAATLNNLGVMYKSLGEYSKALEFLEHALKIRKEIGDRQGEAVGFNNIGIIYKSLGEYSKALEFYEHALNIAKEIGNRQGEAITLVNNGIIYDTFGEHSKALEFYEHALKIRKEIGDRQGEAITLNNIGLIYDTFGEYSKALEFLEHSIKIAKKIGNPYIETESLNNIGIINIKLGKYSKALEFLEHSIKIAKKIGERKIEAGGLAGIGGIFFEKDDFLTAKKYYNEAYSIAKDIKSKPLIFDTSLSIASVYLVENNLCDAEKQLNEILSLVDELDSKEMKAGALCLSGRFYTKKKNWVKARFCFNESISIFQGIKRKFDLAQVYYYQGLMSKESGDKPEAKKSFAKAMRIFKKLGAKRWIERVKDKETGRRGDKGENFK
jgi:diguanylate cyclase (GGDEF)-like protein